MKMIALTCVFAFAMDFAVPAAPPTTPEQLRSDFEIALVAHNTNAIASLIYWKGISDQEKAGILNEAAMLAHQKVVAVDLAAWPTNFPTMFTGKGVRYHYNLDIAGMLVVKLASESRGGIGGAQMPYGKVDGQYLMAATVSEPIAPAPAK